MVIRCCRRSEGSAGAARYGCSSHRNCPEIMSRNCVPAQAFAGNERTRTTDARRLPPPPSAGAFVLISCPAWRSSNASRTSARAGGRTSSSASAHAVRADPACVCSTVLPTRRTTGPSSRLPVTGRPSRPPCSRSSPRRSRPIDLRTHPGEHPRIGAVDVVPFVPIEDVTMEDCVALARDVGAAVADGSACRCICTRRRRPARRAGTSRISAAAGSKGSPRKWRAPGWAPDFGPAGAPSFGGRRGHRRAHAAHRLQHQPRTPTASTSPRRSPPRSGRAAAACATSRRMGFRLETAASSRCR